MPRRDEKPSGDECFMFQGIGGIGKPKPLSNGCVELVNGAREDPRLPAARLHFGENLPELDELRGINGIRRTRPTPEHLAAQQRSVVAPPPGANISCPTRAPPSPPRACTAAISSVAPKH